MSWWTADKQAYAFNFLTSSGLSTYGAAALISRWKNVESSGGPASVNPYSGAFGIAQWLGSRKQPIAGNTSFEAQLDYVVAELNGAESHAGSILRNAGDAYTGAVGASTYERAEGFNPGTGVDNFTSRTASGVAEILQNATGGAGGSYEPQYDSNGWPIEDLSVSDGFGVGTILIVAGIAVVGLIIFSE